MQLVQKTVSICLCVVFAAGSITAQQSSVADPRTIDQALSERAEETRAKRETIRTALHQPDVQRVAARLGVDVTRAQAAIATLDGAELDRLAAQAQVVNDEIAGGQTVRLNLLWVIIGLLVIILIIVAA